MRTTAAAKTDTRPRQKAHKASSTNAILPFTVRATLQSLPPHEANLYEAVARYVEYGKGSPIVIGGIEIQRWPGESKSNYRVAVHVCGKAPAFEKKG